MTNDAPKFTAAEWQIIEHRLEVEDCVAECLSDEANEVHFAFEDVENACHDLRVGGRDSVASVVEKYGRGMIADILEDCLDGSTFFGDIDSEVALENITAANVRKLRRAADTLDAKVSEFCGRRVVTARH